MHSKMALAQLVTRRLSHAGVRMCLFRLLTRGFLSSTRDKNSLHQNGKEDSFLTVELVFWREVEVMHVRCSVHVVCWYMHLCMCVGAGWTFSVFLYCSIVLFETGSLAEPKDQHFSYAGWPASSWDLPVSVPHCWAYRLSWPWPKFMC